MALVKCPECRNKVSDTATACPKCGFDVVGWAAIEKEAKAQRKLEADARTRKFGGIAAAGILGLFILAGLADNSEEVTDSIEPAGASINNQSEVEMAVGEPEDEQAQVASSEWDGPFSEEEAMTRCMFRVERSVKNPSTINVEWFSSEYHQDQAGNLYTAYKFTAKNDFNAEQTLGAGCKFTPTGEMTLSIERL